MAAPSTLQPMRITVRAENQAVHIEIAGLQPFAASTTRTVSLTIQGSQAEAATPTQAETADADVDIRDNTSIADEDLADSSDGEYQLDEELDSGDEEIQKAPLTDLDVAHHHPGGVVALKHGDILLTSTISIQQFCDRILGSRDQYLSTNTAEELATDMLARLIDPASRLLVVSKMKHMMSTTLTRGRSRFGHNEAWNSLRAALPNNGLVASEDFRSFLMAFSTHHDRSHEADTFLFKNYYSCSLIQRLHRVTPAEQADWNSLLHLIRSWFIERTAFHALDYVSGLTLLVVYLDGRCAGNLWLKGGYQEHAKTIRMQASYNSALLQEFFGPGVYIPLCLQYSSNIAELEKISTTALSKILRSLNNEDFEDYENIFRPIQDVVTWHCEANGERLSNTRQLYRNLKVMANEDARISCQEFFELASKQG